MSKCKKKDCLKMPIPPNCFNYCIEKVLRVATTTDKIEVLGMNEDLAQAVFNAYNYGQKRIDSFEDLNIELSNSQITSLKDIFSNLSQSQLDFFSKKI